MWTIIKMIFLIWPILIRMRRAKKYAKWHRKGHKKYNWNKAHKNLQKACRTLSIIKGVKFEIINAPKPNQKFIIVTNHSNFYDIVSLAERSPAPTTFVSKKEVADEKMVSSFAKSIGTYFIDREDIRQSLKMLKRVEKEFPNHDHSVCIFPEGTRNEEFGEFKPGAFRTATNIEATVLPIAIVNAKREKDKNGKRVLKFVCGEPIKTTRKTNVEELSNKCHTFIGKALKEYAISKKAK